MTDEPKTAVHDDAPAAGEDAPTQVGPAAAGHAGRGRRIAYWVVLALATLLATVSIFAVWANRQLLDTDRWTETSTQLLENKAIRDQTAIYLTDQLYTNVDVEAEIRGFLPEALQPLAAPAAGAVRNVVDEAADRALENPTVQAAWATANRTAHESLVRVIKDEGRFTSIEGENVVLDLSPILLSVAQRLGLPQAVVNRIPPDAARVEVLKAGELKTAQSVVKALGTLDWLLRLLVAALFGLAIWLARGRRSQALVASGAGLVLAGLAVLIVRSIAGASVVDELTTTEAVRPAAAAAWTIGTDLLATLAWSTIFVGVPAIVVGLLLGPYGWARDARARLAPTAHNRPEWIYGGALLIVLLLLVWDPVPATRRVLSIAVLIAVIVGGAYALRRFTLEENPDPDALPERTGPGLRARAAGAAASARDAARLQREPSEVAGSEVTDRVARLERLVALRDGGALTEAEFEAEKAKLLSEVQD